MIIFHSLSSNLHRLKMHLSLNLEIDQCICTCSWEPDPEECRICVQRPASFFGVPAVFGLACGRGTSSRVDRTPGYKLVPQLLLGQQ